MRAHHLGINILVPRASMLNRTESLRDRSPVHFDLLPIQLTPPLLGAVFFALCQHFSNLAFLGVIGGAVLRREQAAAQKSLHGHNRVPGGAPDCHGRKKDCCLSVVSSMGAATQEETRAPLRHTRTHAPQSHFHGTAAERIPTLPSGSHRCGSGPSTQDRNVQRGGGQPFRISSSGQNP